MYYTPGFQNQPVCGKVGVNKNGIDAVMFYKISGSHMGNYFT